MRITWIDTLRGICMIAILLFHTEVYYVGETIVPYQCYVHDALAAFFFVSGYLFIRNGKFSFSHKIKSIMRSILLPYFIFTIIIAALKVLFLHVDAGEAFGKIILGQASWFVSALIVAELLMAVILLITRGKSLLLCFVAILAFSAAFIIGNKHNPSPLHYAQNLWFVNDGLMALGIMICGILYHRYEQVFDRFHNILYTSFLFILLVIIKIMIIKGDEATVIGSVEVSNIPLFLADITVAILFLTSVCKWLGRVFLVSWTGAHSLVYYFFCGASPTFVAILLNKIGFTYSSYWQVIIALILVYDICTIIAWLVFRYTPWLIGKRKKSLLIILLMLFFVPEHLFAQTFSQMKEEATEYSLPLVNITADTEKITSTEFITGEIEFFDPEGTYSQSHKCLLRYRGASSLRYDKKSFAIKLLDDMDNDLDCDLFGIREENSWILDAMAADKIRMRNMFCFTLWNEISITPYNTQFNNRNGIKGLFVEVFLNGQYHGLFCLSDKVDRKLLALKKIKTDKEENQTIRGLLYKCVSWGGGSNLNYYYDEPTDNATWNAWELKYPEDYPSTQTWQPLIDFIDFCSSDNDDDIFLEHYEEYFYVDNFMDYLLFVCAMGLTDNTYKNCYLSIVNINDDHKMLLTPWDMDSSLGRLYNGYEYKNLFNIVNYMNLSPVKRLYLSNKDGFKDKMIARWQQLAATTLCSSHVRNIMEEYINKVSISGAWQRERDKWNDNPVSLPVSQNEELEYIMEWYGQNLQFIDNTISAIATDITNLQTPYTYYPETIYDLHGRAVIRPSKGIYIKDGKKYICK